jgi:hypothetical protein
MYVCEFEQASFFLKNFSIECVHAPFISKKFVGEGFETSGEKEKEEEEEKEEDIGLFLIMRNVLNDALTFSNCVRLGCEYLPCHAR